MIPWHWEMLKSSVEVKKILQNFSPTKNAIREKLWYIHIWNTIHQWEWSIIHKTIWMNLTNIMLDARIQKKNILYDSIYIKYKNQGKQIYVFRNFYPLEGRSNWEAAKGDSQVAGNILFLDLGADYTSLQLVKIHWDVLFYVIFYFNKNFSKCHYTRSHFLCPGKNRAVYLEFLLQISIYPKQEQEKRRSLQGLLNNLIRLQVKARPWFQRKMERTFSGCSF